MTYADDFNLRQSTATAEDVANAIDGLLVSYATQSLSAAISTTSTSSTIYTGSSISINVPDGAIVEIFAHARLSHGTDNTNSTFTVEQDGTDIGLTSRFNSHRADTNGRDISLFYTNIVAPSAGLHTYKLKWQTSSGTLYSDNAYLSIKVFQNT